MLYFLVQITRTKAFSCFNLHAWRNFWNSHGLSLWILMPITIVSRLPIFISLSPSHPYIMLPNQPWSFPSGFNPHTLFSGQPWPLTPIYIASRPAVPRSSVPHYQHAWCIIIMATVMTEKLWEQLACYQAAFSCILFMHGWHLRFNPVGKDS